MVAVPNNDTSGAARRSQGTREVAVQVRSKLRMSPAAAAGISGCLWQIGDTVALVEAFKPKPKRRGPHKK